MASGFDFLKALEVFVSIAETGSMTMAAKRLGVTQSAISQQIKLLEADFGGALLDRQSRPLRLTPSGTTLHQRASRLLLEASETRAHVRRAARGRLPNLRFAVLSTFAKTIVPAVTSAMEDGRLALDTVSIMRGLSLEHAQELAEREIDIAITSNALYDIDGIDRHELVREKYILLVPRGIKARGKTLREISMELPLLRSTLRTESGQRLERHLRRLRLDVPYQYAFESPEDRVVMVGKGLGWTIATPSQVIGYLSNADKQLPIDFLEFPKPGLSRNITLITRRGEFSALAAEVAGLCRKAILKDLMPAIRSLPPQLADSFKVLTGNEPAMVIADT